MYQYTKHTSRSFSGWPSADRSSPPILFEHKSTERSSTDLNCFSVDCSLLHIVVHGCSKLYYRAYNEMPSCVFHVYPWIPGTCFVVLLLLLVCARKRRIWLQYCVVLRSISICHREACALTQSDSHSVHQRPPRLIVLCLFHQPSAPRFSCGRKVGKCGQTT